MKKIVQSIIVMFFLLGAASTLTSVYAQDPPVPDPGNQGVGPGVGTYTEITDAYSATDLDGGSNLSISLFGPVRLRNDSQGAFTELMAHKSNDGKLFRFRSVDASSSEALWSLENGILAKNAADKAAGAVEQLKTLGKYFEFGANTGFHFGLLGLMGYILAFFNMLVRGFGGVILYILTLTAYVIQWFGTLIYQLIDVFNVFKWIESLVDLKTLATDVDFSKLDPENAFAQIASMFATMRSLSIIFMFILFGYGLFATVMGIRLHNARSGTRMAIFNAAVRRFVIQLFVLTGGISLLAALVTGFSEAMSKDYDDFGIQEEITGLIAYPRAAFEGPGGYLPYSPAAKIDVELSASNVKKILENKDLSATEKEAELLSLNEVPDPNATKPDNKAEEERRKEIEKHNENLYMSEALSEMLDSYQPGQIISPSGVRKLNQTENVKASTISRIKDIYMNKVENLTVNDPNALAKYEAIYKSMQSEFQKASQTNISNFFSSIDARLITGWMTSRFVYSAQFKAAYGPKSFIGQIYSFVPEGVFLHKEDLGAPFAMERAQTYEFVIPGGVGAPFLFIRVCLVLIGCIWIAFKVYAAMFNILWNFIISTFSDLPKVAVLGSAEAFMYLAMSTFVMILSIVIARISLSIFIEIIRFPEKLLDAVAIIPGGVLLQAAASVNSTVSNFSSVGEAIFKVILTAVMIWLVATKILDPFLEKFQTSLHDTMRVLVAKMISGTQGQFATMLTKGSDRSLDLATYGAASRSEVDARMARGELSTLNTKSSAAARYLMDGSRDVADKMKTMGVDAGKKVASKMGDVSKTAAVKAGAATVAAGKAAVNAVKEKIDERSLKVDIIEPDASRRTRRGRVVSDDVIDGDFTVVSPDGEVVNDINDSNALPYNDNRALPYDSTVLPYDSTALPYEEGNASSGEIIEGYIDEDVNDQDVETKLNDDNADVEVTGDKRTTVTVVEGSSLKRARQALAKRDANSINSKLTPAEGRLVGTFESKDGGKFEVKHANGRHYKVSKVPNDLKLNKDGKLANAKLTRSGVIIAETKGLTSIQNVDAVKSTKVGLDRQSMKPIGDVQVDDQLSTVYKGSTNHLVVKSAGIGESKASVVGESGFVMSGTMKGSRYRLNSSSNSSVVGANGAVTGVSGQVRNAQGVPKSVAQNGPVVGGKPIAQNGLVVGGKPVVQNGPVAGGKPIAQNGPVVGGKPIAQNGSVVGGKPIAQNGPVVGGKPVVQNSPVAGGKPVVQNGPVAGGKPVVQNGPVAGGKPVVQNGSVAGGKPVVQNGPVAGGKPVVQNGPVAGGKPIAQNGPITGGKPVVQNGPVAGGKPVVQNGPVTGGKPVVQNGPVTGGKPVVQNGPVAGGKPVVQNGPVAGGKPVVQNGPVAGGKSFKVTSGDARRVVGGATNIKATPQLRVSPELPVEPSISKAGTSAVAGVAAVGAAGAVKQVSKHSTGATGGAQRVNVDGGRRQEATQPVKSVGGVSDSTQTVKDSITHDSSSVSVDTSTGKSLTTSTVQGSSHKTPKTVMAKDASLGRSSGLNRVDSNIRDSKTVDLTSDAKLTDQSSMIEKDVDAALGGGSTINASAGASGGRPSVDSQLDGRSAGRVDSTNTKGTRSHKKERKVYGQNNIVSDTQARTTHVNRTELKRHGALKNNEVMQNVGQQSVIEKQSNLMSDDNHQEVQSLGGRRELVTQTKLQPQNDLRGGSYSMSDGQDQTVRFEKTSRERNHQLNSSVKDKTRSVKGSKTSKVNGNVDNSLLEKAQGLIDALLEDERQAGLDTNMMKSFNDTNRQSRFKQPFNVRKRPKK